MVTLGSHWATTEKEQQEQAVLGLARAEGSCKAEDQWPDWQVPQSPSTRMWRSEQVQEQLANTLASRQAHKQWDRSKVEPRRPGERVRSGSVNTWPGTHPCPARVQGQLPSFKAASEWKETACSKASSNGSSLNSSLVQGCTDTLSGLALSPDSQKLKRGV